ncbi:ATP-binding cassette domain-containing protein [Paenibacillus albicereus]|uniref:ATP-binding cassette domain-containing protein n=1 Tax=Paenibacillus albicereus TaxID=2726185 RepID=A0A6H2GU97_9BACL|nr:ATP-binding cassette domain-containing protein [Paenibacillus albicereus]QJC50929.1 ATP-binding cassette domain-containing protein [Paenibacillus albicereus]
MIEAAHLHKSFKLRKPGPRKGLRSLLGGSTVVKEAVRDVSFTIASGEFTGFIGPNGAGKSTTIKMLSGILHPSSGSVRLSGIDPHRRRVDAARTLGVLFGQRTQLWWDLPLRDSFEVLGAMYRMEAKRRKTRVDELDGLLRLSTFLDTPVRKLSLGQRMRGDLAAALLHEPPILILDEPTIGLDVSAKRDIRSLLRGINRELGTTILLTTHDMDDIEQLCGRVLVLTDGALSYDGPIGGLRSRIGMPASIEATYRTLEQAQSARQKLSQLESGSLVAIGVQERTLIVQCSLEQRSFMDVLRQLEAYGELEDARMHEADFEEAVQRLYAD